jgi:cell division protein FtsN
MYQLLIDRSSLWLLLACLALAFVLIFVGGLVVGHHDRATAPTGAVASPSTRATVGVAAKPTVTAPRASVRTPTVSQPSAPRVTAPRVTVQTPSTPTSTAPPPAATEPEPQVAAVATPSPTAASAAASGDGAPFAVQVGAYRERQYLEEAKAEIEVRGYTPDVQPDRDSSGKLFYRLLIGSYKTREEAQQAADQIEAKESWAAFPQRRRDS